MSLRLPFFRSVRPLLKANPCVLCQFRSSQTVRHYAALKPRTTAKWDSKGKTPQEMRTDIDKRNRYGFLYMMRHEGMLALEPDAAEQLIADFLASEKSKVDPVANVQALAKKYDLNLVDITYIAIPLLRVPDVNGASTRLPPSQHPSIAAHLLTACSAAKDAMATLQILSAVYHSSNDNIPKAREIARLFSPTDIKNCKTMLETLAAEGNADAMTLQGQFLEKAGQKTQAKALYEKALEKFVYKFDPKYPHPMALPREPPWTALAFLLQSEKTPEALAKAKAVLEKGALKADDPIAYYQLASFEDGTTPEWLTYMSKAAASGHLEATYKLGHFYLDVNTEPSAFLENMKFNKALKFLTSWKPGSAERIAKEWFEVAAAGGHKEAMLELAELYDAEGDQNKATEYLRRIVEPSETGATEEWPRLVEQTRKRLAGLNIARPEPA